MQSDTPPPPPVFVVIMDEVLVARDIEMIIGDARPNAHIVRARRWEDAEAQLPDGPIEAVFLQRDAAQFMLSPIGQRLAESGGRIVLVGLEPFAAAVRVSVLQLPFLRTDIETLLAETNDT